jgi:DNA gyrase subunit B/topoisomerase-4 subunit B
VSKKAKEYNASSIDVNEGLDVVRATPQIYVSNPDSHALYVIFKEPVDNNFDECNEGHGKDVFVAIDGENYWSADQGRGIPVEKHPKTQISTLTTVFTTLSAGGKMRKEGSSYSSNTAGVHGMGVSITNALSEKLQVWTWRSNKCYTQKFSKGKPTSKVIETKWPKIPHLEKQPKKQGTVVCFTPDYTMFDEGAKLSTTQVKNFLELSSYLRKGVRIHFANNKGNKLYYQPEGLIQYANHIMEKEELEKVGKPFTVQKGTVDLILQWSSGTDEVTHTFVNKTPTKEGGTHLNGLTKALADAIKPFAGKRAKYSAEDLRSGLVCVLNAEVSVPRFSTQIKDKLVTPEANQMVYDLVKPDLQEFFSKNKSLVKEILSKAEELSKIRETFTASKKAISDMRKASRSRLPSKLGACTSKNPDEIELFLVEGDSAAGPAKRSRDRKFQEVLPLRGKLINAYTAKPEKLMANTEVQDIMTACGFSEGEKSKRRVGKVIFLTDPDKDAKHIEVLLASLFKKVMPQMFKEGRIYLIRTPLYNCQYKGKRFFAESQEELLKQIGGRVPVGGIQRVKGLGELNDAKLADVALNPETRVLTQLKDINDKDYKKYIQVVGKDGEMRKELLEIKGVGIND